MIKWKIYNEDVVEWAQNYQKGKFHALLCDPPYHLQSIVKRFGKKGSAPAKYGTDGVFSRSSSGFMGQQWDGGDIAFRPETWAAFHAVLLPGAFGMAFSASRNWHRLAVAIEDAGYIIHPTIFLWVQGQGFPKATNISKQIRPASEQKVIGRNPSAYRANSERNHQEGQVASLGLKAEGSGLILEPTDELAKTWVGHRYGLQALKPAVEPIIVFQKPYEGKPLDNITETGAGALNIDASRIPLAVNDEYTINEFDDGMKPFGNGAGHKYTSKKVGVDASQLRTMNRSKKSEKDGWGMNDKASDTPQVVQENGRWPSNLILDTGAAERLDAQTGVRTSGKMKQHIEGGEFNVYGKQYPRDVETIGDTGGASRFFYVVQEKIDKSDPAYYCAKVSPKERNAGLDEMEEKEMSYMNTHNGNPVEGETWHPIDDRTGEPRDRFKSKAKNTHPTLKPIDLARYLATMLLPPEEYAPRRILIPFSGAGSEMIGAGLAGWERIVGIENDTENGYVEIAKSRLEHWIDDKASK